MTECNKRRRICNDKACALETDESNEKTNTYTDGNAEIWRYCIDDRLTYMADGEN